MKTPIDPAQKELIWDAQGRRYEAYEVAHMVALSRFLAAKDYAGLTRAMLETSIQLRVASLNWARERVLEGHGLLIVELYAQLLWRYRDEADDAYQAGIGRMALYAMAIAYVDKVTCSSDLSPVTRMAYAAVRLLPQLRKLAQSSQALRNETVERVLKLEKEHAAARAEDDYLCRGGVVELGQALNSSELSAAEPAGPLFAPRAVWEPQQAVLRSSLRQYLEVIVEFAGDADLCAKLTIGPPDPRLRPFLIAC